MLSTIKANYELTQQQLYEKDGTPYIDRTDRWGPTQQAIAGHNLLRRFSILRRTGPNVVGDTAERLGFDRRGDDDDEPLCETIFDCR
jgi:hypothetical protein